MNHELLNKLIDAAYWKGRNNAHIGDIEEVNGQVVDLQVWAQRLNDNAIEREKLIALIEAAGKGGG